MLEETGGAANPFFRRGTWCHRSSQTDCLTAPLAYHGRHATLVTGPHPRHRRAGAASLHGAAQTPAAGGSLWILGRRSDGDGPDGEARRGLRSIRERRLEAADGDPGRPAVDRRRLRRLQPVAGADSRDHRPGAAHQPARRHVPQLHERSRGRSARRQAAAGGREARGRARRQGRVRALHGRDQRRVRPDARQRRRRDPIRSTRR